MKKIKLIFTCITLLCALVLICSSFSIYGDWTYFADIVPMGYTVYHHMGVFEYKPEEILPGGESNNQEVELGGNHFVLVDLILNENDKGYGLNINNNVLLHQYLKKQKVVFSNQKVSGGNLKFILDPSNNTHGLYYCLEKVSDTEYNAYTFSTSELERVMGTSEEIVAYKTILKKTTKWEATTSFLGYAKTSSLTSLGANADPKAIPYSIDVETWHS